MTHTILEEYAINELLEEEFESYDTDIWIDRDVVKPYQPPHEWTSVTIKINLTIDFYKMKNGWIGAIYKGHGMIWDTEIDDIFGFAAIDKQGNIYTERTNEGWDEVGYIVEEELERIRKEVFEND